MFDGVVAATAIDAASAAAKLPATDGGILHFAAAYEQQSSTLAASRQVAEKTVADYLQRPDALQQLFSTFNGGESAPDAAWTQAAQDLISKVTGGSYSVQVELRSNLELRGAMGAFATQSENGTPVIYLNADWLAMGPSSEQVSRVLVEEIGHSFDAAINGSRDTAGDEGDAFAILLLGANFKDSQRLGLDDHATLIIDGVNVTVEEASATFKAVYQGTPSAWSLQASSLTLTGKLDAVANTIKFISADPTAPLFAGNNVAGTLVYTDSAGAVHTMDGVISRQFKNGSTTNAFYFYNTGSDGLVNGAGDSAYLLQVANDATTYVYDGSAAAMVRTSSDPVDKALNDIKDSTIPTLTAATSIAKEAGVNADGSAAAGQDGNGNVLTGLSSGFGSGLNVISAGTSDPASQSNVTSGTTSTNGTSVIGSYGTLKIGADGSYKYVVNNSNTSVNALRQSTDTLTDTFTYTAKDSAGNLATTTLTVTIQGQNDAPVANNDYNTAKIGSTAVTGSVLTNDTDVDKYGEILSLFGLTASATVGTYSSGTNNITFSGISGASVKNADAVAAVVGGTAYALYDANGVAITCTANSSGGTVPISGVASYYVSGSTHVSYAFKVGDSVQFGTGTNAKTGTVATAPTNPSITVSVASASSLPAAGMTVSSGIGIAVGSVITSVTTSGGNYTISFDRPFSGTPSGAVTFTGTISSSVTFGGLYGSLVLNSNGSYTYTPNASGTGGHDVFAYQVTDLAGVTKTATLDINVLAATATNPTAVADTASITEDASPNTIVRSTAGSGGNGLLANDTTPTGTTLSSTAGVVAGRAASDASETSIGSGSTVTLTGLYGSLALKSDGTYTYTLDNGNSAVNALNSGSSLTDVFYYRIQNNGGSGNQDLSTLTVTINGANDAPTLKLNASSGSTNYVATYTQGDAGAALATLTGAHITDVDNIYFSKLTVSYTQSNFTDGSNEQLKINGTATVISGLGTLASNSNIGSFTVGGVTYSYGVAVSGGVATLTFTPGSVITRSQAESLLTALRYYNGSSNPTANSSRVFSLTVFDDGNEAGTPTGILSSNTATSTITVYNTSTAPVATADAVTATEASGSNNGTPGVDPTGNVLTGDTSNSTGTGIGDSGDTITVTQAEKGSSLDVSATSVAANSTSTSNAASITGNYGTLTIGADGSYKYAVDNTNATVNALQVGSHLTDTFVYQITDKSGVKTSATLTVSINGADDAPSVGSTPANQTASVNLPFSYQIPAFSDVDTGDTITYSYSGTLPAGITFNTATRTFSGTPTATMSAQTITVRGTDSKGAYVETTFTLQATAAAAVFSGKDTDSATEDSGSYVKGGQVTATYGGSATTIVAQTNVAGNYGTFSIDSSGNWTYTANNTKLQPLSTSAQATETFTIASADGTTHNIVITLNGGNDAPTATATSVTIDEDTILNGTLPPATDVDTGDTVTYAAGGTTPSHGSVTVNADGTYTYTPTGNYSGTDTFSYTVSDGKGGSNTYLVTITVSPVNDSPSLSVPGPLSVNEDTDLAVTGISLDDPDAASGTMTVTLSVTHGTINVSDIVSGGLASGNIAGNGSGSVTLTGTLAQINATLAGTNGVVYRGNLDFNGSDPLTITANDGGNTGSGGPKTDTHVVAITVDPVNDAPVNTLPTSLSVNEDTDLPISALSISDVDAGSSNMSVTLSVSNGTITVTSGVSGGLAANGISGSGSKTVTLSGSQAQINATLATVVYRGDLNFNGDDTLTVTTDDLGYVGSGGAKSDTDSLTISVAPVNDPPVATQFTKTLLINSEVGFDTLRVPYTDVDVGDSPTAFKLLSLPSNGHIQYFDGTNWGNISSVGTGLEIAMGELAKYRYASDGNTGNFSFDWQIQTGNGGNAAWSNTAQGTFTVSATANTAPTVSLYNGSDQIPDNGTITINEDSTLTLRLNLSDAQTSSGSLIVLKSSSQSALVDGATTELTIDESTKGAGYVTVTIRPTADMYGTSTISLGASDGDLSTITSFTLTVNSVNDAPTASDFGGTINEDGSFSLSSINPGAVYNDSKDIDKLAGGLASPLSAYYPQSFVFETLPSNGTLYLDGTAVTSGNFTVLVSDIGKLVYRPNADFNGTDALTWHAVDADGGVSNSAQCTFTINPLNDAPIATGSATLMADAEDTPVDSLQSATVAALFGSTFSDNTDAQYHASTNPSGSMADTLAGIAISNYSADASKGIWQYSSNGTDWTDIASITSASSALSLKNTDSLRFAPAANWNGAAPTLSAKLIDSSTTVITGATVDATGGGTTAYSSGTVMLSHSVTPVNDPATIDAGASDVNATGTVTEDTSLQSGNQLQSTGTLSISDNDTGEAKFSTTVTPMAGAWGTLTITEDGAWTYTVDNGKTELQALKNGETRTETFTVTSADGSATQTISITIHGVDDLLTVNNITVNEASPFAVFRVSGTAGQTITLELVSTGTGSGYATITGSDRDVNAQLQYFDGNGWVDYTGTPVTYPAGSTTLLVRAPIINDNVYEGAESFALKTVADGSITVYGAGTIGDDGRGAIFNESGAENFDPNIVKDDDRSLRVSSFDVNEGADYGVFTVTGTAGDLVTFDLAAGSATLGTDTGTALQYNDGTAWKDYTNGSQVTLPTSGLLRVRVAIKNDTDKEGPETFLLNVADVTSSLSSFGTATIRDDGTGDYWIGNSIAPASAADLLANHRRLDDDFDQDGIAPNVEEILATMSSSTGNGGFDGDLNSDGIPDAVQNAVATIAWTTVDKYEAALAGTLTEVKPIIAVQVVSANNISDDAHYQLQDIKVLPTTGGIPDGNITGGRPVSVNGDIVTTPWDPIQFSITPSTGSELQDIDANRTGTQVRIVIDISRAGMTTNDFNAYLKYVTADAISAANAANITLRDLDGKIITKAGWYDFTQRSAGGDGARFVLAPDGKTIVAIEITITDNAFGDDDMTVGKVLDPGVPVLRVAAQGQVPVPQILPTSSEERHEHPAKAAPEFPEGPNFTHPPFDSTLFVLQSEASPKDARFIEPSSWNWLPQAQTLDETQHADPFTEQSQWRAAVLPAEQVSLQVFRGMSDQYADRASAGSFIVPADAFVHTRSTAWVALVAEQANGKALPAWVQFDSQSGVFRFDTPENFHGELKIKLTARDTEGREASTLFRFQVGNKREGVTGRAGLSEQLRDASRTKVQPRSLNERQIRARAA